MKKFPKPKVVISKCLEFDACRYNSQLIPNDFVRILEPHVTYVPVCPEVEIGLGVPRDPIRIIEKNGEQRLVQPSTGKDISDRMREFALSYLSSLNEVDGFILKNRSPSCGINDVKIHAGSEDDSSIIGKTSGFFAQKVIEKFPGLAIEDEGRLTNFRIREHFLTKLFTLANFREVKKENSIKSLIDFQSDNKFLLMAYDQEEMRKLGNIAANRDGKSTEEVLSKYEEHLSAAFSDMPKHTSNINVLMHAMGHFSDKLSSEEKSYFLDLLEKYREAKIPLSATLTVLKSWTIRCDEKYLARQTFFEPYPEELALIKDSGKGRNL